MKPPREAGLPPNGLAGFDPAWSNLVTAVDQSGRDRTWHVLDTGVSPSQGTLLCVHGNPSWSYMWREVARTMTDWRVIAVDALNMGYSERTGSVRTLDDHIADLDAVTRAMNVAGPVVTLAHDWGGPVSIGWAHKNRTKVTGMVLMNTGVARPPSVRVPPLISIARSTLKATCETTPAFLHGALQMAKPRLERDVYRGYAAPYGSADLRTGIRDFVGDIPVEESHRTYARLKAVADALDELQQVPSLLVWGSKDLIFTDAFLADLMQRMPLADVHRYADSGHQVIEETDAVDVIRMWIERTATEQPSAPPQPSADDDRRIWSAIEARTGDETDAIVEMSAGELGDIARSISFDELAQNVEALSRGLIASGIRKGDRLAPLVPPGIDLMTLVYGCLRAGIVVVALDAALGLDGMRRALRSSRPDHIVGDWRGLLVAKSVGRSANFIPIDPMPRPLAKPTVTLRELLEAGQDAQPVPTAGPEDHAAIVFTSGSTGPSKGVVYTHGQLEAQRDSIRDAFAIDAGDNLVAAFAPFAVLAPALGITSAIPAMDVTAPGELRVHEFASAARAIGATIAFASPAVLENLAATAGEASAQDHRNLARIRMVGTAGAPVSRQLLARAELVFPKASFHTPYGMTEVLPVTSALAASLPATDSGRGVCVGKPLAQVDVEIRPIGATTTLIGSSLGPGALGEVYVRAAHSAAGYDRLWGRQHRAFVNGWHRSGDVGHLDARGQLWIEGRIDDLIHGAGGTLTPVPIELEAESAAGVAKAAAVGIGPIGTQQLCVVVTGASGVMGGKGVIAGATVTAAVRDAVTAPVAAVLVVARLPVDRRHNSKLNRSKIRGWAEAVLRGDRPRRL